jgi:hypothetical protein
LALRRRGRAGLAADRLTLALAGVAGAAVTAVMAAELTRVWRRGSAPLPQEADDLFEAAGEAVAEAAQVAAAGYRQTPPRENALFNLFSSFVLTFLIARGVTYGLRRRGSVWGPFRTLRLGRRHVHHYVPGIVLAFGAGAAAIVVEDESIEPWLAVPFGVGMGLTLDESALLLELEDVYWQREGLLSVQITLAVTSLLAALALGLRFLRRGERAVLENA